MGSRKCKRRLGFRSKGAEKQMRSVLDAGMSEECMEIVARAYGIIGKAKVDAVATLVASEVSTERTQGGCLVIDTEFASAIQSRLVGRLIEAIMDATIRCHSEGDRC